MLKKQRILTASALIAVSLMFGSCKSDYEKLKASNDVAKKYREAVKYYNKKDYNKALDLFDDLTQRYRGKAEAEDLFYYYAYTNYKLKDYTSAGYHFKNFAENYPSSTRAEECRYMAAYCSYLDSPNYQLDQTNSSKAIEQLQLFINLYPKSERVADASKLIQNLRNKLEEKSYADARLYYDIGDYLSAVMAFNNSLRDYPDTKYAEEMEFMMIKAQYLYARNSLYYKQEDRYNQAISYADQFTEKYPNSKYLREAASYRKISDQGIKQAKVLVAEASVDSKVAKKLAKKDTTTGQPQSVVGKQNERSPQNQ
ncbi:outer membrane protein assembly factor BamD [Mucilaginibacter robiniae]|uniref:Outer membrane protein assembly factor BamD n=1 Tax=Mucilaginibacter robiniae TaxID=2728022 RepID=A0A7L5E2M6_9SPHI|nr:outer membrane protein assembly factor BamD [Mucilaginibacter robiniae]QJD95053.1 outer membrane protein assembly factor BamD [Mucilaginibacter robiniae]